MNTHGCGYDFPLIAIAGKAGSTIKANVSSYLNFNDKIVANIIYA